MTKAELETAMRTEILEVICKALAEHFDLDPKTQVPFVSANEITLPLCDKEGNEKFPVVKVSIPRGERDGDGGYIPYDGYAAAEAYQEDLAEKRAKKAKAEQKKADAIAAKKRKQEAKQVVKDLNEKGFQNMVKGAE